MQPGSPSGCSGFCWAEWESVRKDTSTISDINTGTTWADGEEVNAARLNNMLNDAVIEPEFVSTKPTATPASTDKVLFYQATTDTLKVAPISSVVQVGTPALGVVQANFIQAGPVSGANAVPTFRHLQSQDYGTAILANAVLAGPPLPTPSGSPTFRHLVPTDLASGALSIPGSNIIDWNLSRTFVRSPLTANTTFTFANINLVDGGSIIVVVGQGAGPFTIAWPSTYFPATAVINMSDTTVNTRLAMFMFTSLAGAIFGAVLASNQIPRTS